MTAKLMSMPAETPAEVKTFPSSIYSTPTIANGRIYVTDRSRLYCFDAFGKGAGATTE